MKEDIHVREDIIIPAHELEIATSRAGGPGGQHVQKASTRITVRWNVKTTTALTDEQKALVLENLQSRLTTEGELIIHNAASRSQQQNKKNAFAILAKLVRKALYIAKKRIKTKTPQQVQESRLQKKARRSVIKKMRSKKIRYDE